MSVQEELRRPWLRHYPAGVRANLDYPDLSVHSLMEQAASEHPDWEATNLLGARLTWQQVRERVDAFAAALQALGVNPGDRVAIQLPNCPQTVIAFFGVLKAGAIVVMTNPLYVERELEHQLHDSGAETLVCLDHLWPRVERVAPHTPVKRLIVTSLTESLPFPLNLLYPLKAKKDGLNMQVPDRPDVHRFGKLLRQYRGRQPAAHAVDPGDVAVLQYTGGTTGVAKGAMLTHRNLVANIMQVKEWQKPLDEPGAQLRILTVMPLFHVYGLTVCLGLAAASAGALLLVPRFDPGQMLKVIHKYKPSTFPGAPTIYVGLLNHPDVGKYNLRSIRSCISGSAAMPVEVQNKFEAVTGARIAEGYGLTEASPVTHCNPLAGKRVVGSIGIPLSDTDMRIVDLETGSDELPPGEAGELCIRGPQVMQGYWNRSEETAAVLRDGWLYTGDVARMDEDGFTYIVDRKKEMIIAGGYNIYPREVEEVLYEHPAVQEAAVVGVPDPYRGETVKAFITKKPGTEVTAEEIIAWSRERMAKYKAPTQVEFRAELPKTLVGKVLRRALREEELRKQNGESG